MVIAKFVTEYSYNQLVVYDSWVDLPGNDWSETHFNQGFSRTASSVSFRTLLDFGCAQVQVFDEQYETDESDVRVIEVPFFTGSGKVFVEGPEENSPNAVQIQPGLYTLTAAQRANFGDDTLSVRLYFSRIGATSGKSRIIVRDAELDPPEHLLE